MYTLNTAHSPVVARRLDWFTIAVVSAFPIMILDLRLPVPSLRVRVSDFYIIGTFLYFFFFKPGAVRWTLNALKWFLPFLAYLLIAAIWRQSVGATVELIQWLLILMWIPLLSYAFKDNLADCLDLLIYGLAAVAVYVAFYHIAFLGKWYSYKQLGNSVFVFGLLTVLVLTRTWSRGGARLWLLSILAVILLVLSDERKGILISAMAIGISAPVLAMSRSKAMSGPVAVLMLLFAMCSGFIFFHAAIKGSEELIYFLDEQLAGWHSNTHRANLIANGVEIFSDHPWFGVGGKGLKYYMEGFYLNERLGLYTHNWYLDLLVEYGLVGALLYMLAALPALWSLPRRAACDTSFYPLLLYSVTVPIFMSNGTTTTFVVVTCLAIGYILKANDDPDRT